MRRYLSLRRTDDYSTWLTIGGPFERKVEVNFVQKDGKMIVIPTGSWADDLRVYPFARVNTKTMKATFDSADSYIEIFKEKYGENHFSRYFSRSEDVIVLEPCDREPGYSYETLGSLFDRITAQYSKEILSNWVQRYMREQSFGVLDRFVQDGNAILDLGCGPSSEVIKLDKRLEITEVDVSKVALDISREAHTPGMANIKWILLRKDNDILGEYDIIFSSYGYLNIESPANVIRLLNNNLKLGGYFIGSFMNRYGLLDLLVSLLQRRWNYVKERTRGHLPAGSSRFNALSFPRSPNYLASLEGLKIEERRGICFVIPPYNYSRLVDAFERIGFTELLKSLDSHLGSFPILWSGSDYILFVCRKTGKIFPEFEGQKFNKGY